MQGLTKMLNSVMPGQEELRYALVVSTEFKLRDGEIIGYLLAVRSFSLERVLRTVENLG